jgi:hypothetical protein
MSLQVTMAQLIEAVRTSKYSPRRRPDDLQFWDFPESSVQVYAKKNVPLHACYETPQETHPDDREFCFGVGQ